MKSASIDKLRSAVLYACLFTLTLVTCYSNAVIGREKPDFAEPFRKCRSYGGQNGLSKIIASDNVNELLLTTDNHSIISLNNLTFTENWKSQTSGRLESFGIADNNNLFFLTSVEVDEQSKIFNLSSVSLKTGVANWQRQLRGYDTFLINSNYSKEYIFLLAGKNLLMAVSKADGQNIWIKELNGRISALDYSEPERISVLLNDRLLFVSARSGAILGEARLKKNTVTTSVIGDTYLLLGYSTGEIEKVEIDNGKEDIIWKIKTGASISGIIEYKDEILITSLDNFIYLYSGESGKLKWKKRVAGRINIKPRIFGDYAAVINAGDNSTSIINLRDGKVVNQIQLEEDNFFSGQPFIAGEFVVLQTFRGLYFYANASTDCT